MNVSILVEEDDFNHDSPAPVEEDDLNSGSLISIHIQDDFSGNSLASVEEDVSDDSSPVPVGEDDSNHSDRPTISHEGSAPSSYTSIDDLPDADQHPVVQPNPIELPVPVSPPSIFRRGGAPLSQNSFAFHGSLPLHRGNRKMHSAHPQEPPRKANQSANDDVLIKDLESQVTGLMQQLNWNASLHKMDKDTAIRGQRQLRTEAEVNFDKDMEVLLLNEREKHTTNKSMHEHTTNVLLQGVREHHQQVIQGIEQDFMKDLALNVVQLSIEELRSTIGTLQHNLARLETTSQENLDRAIAVEAQLALAKQQISQRQALDVEMNDLSTLRVFLDRQFETVRLQMADRQNQDSEDIAMLVCVAEELKAPDTPSPTLPSVDVYQWDHTLDQTDQSNEAEPGMWSLPAIWPFNWGYLDLTGCFHARFKSLYSCWAMLVADLRHLESTAQPYEYDWIDHLGERHIEQDFEMMDVRLWERFQTKWCLPMAANLAGLMEWTSPMVEVISMGAEPIFQKLSINDLPEELLDVIF
ncbi:hypothetical protein ARMSODRAFT_1010478 [Armillaria solidipes]|uniref:Uncharacterized protein n=1 Tax=Armillaria solidipes TaxID=1076256 RepID=A0A2H3C448_9AGAR|nr:hypothetical protein ARMSODRAFT_1010478 [Armillaria solidipes]